MNTYQEDYSTLIIIVLILIILFLAYVWYDCRQNEKKEHLSGGAITGIFFAVVCGIAILAGIAGLIVRAMNKSQVQTMEYY